MSEGFPLLTTKKMYWKGIVTELIWFLRGDTNIKFLVDNDCNIWTGDAYKNYQKQVHIFSERFPFENRTQEEFTEAIKADDEFAKTFGDLGPVYGKQWRAFGGYEKIPSGWNHNVVTHFNHVPKNDQIANLINDLKTNPDSRRLMVSAWNVGELDSMVLPPCHYGFQVYTRELTASERITYKNTKQINLLDSNELFDFIKSNVTMDLDDEVHKVCDESNIPTRAISLMWNQRSVDTFLGLPFNIASYGLLLEIIAKTVNMVPDELIGNLGDVHLYENHLSQSGQQITRTPYQLPKLVHMKTDEFYKSLSEDMSLFTHLENTDFVVENYQSHPTIKAPLSN
jgi:thymidylate synthase